MAFFSNGCAGEARGKIGATLTLLSIGAVTGTGVYCTAAGAAGVKNIMNPAMCVFIVGTITSIIGMICMWKCHGWVCGKNTAASAG